MYGRNYLRIVCMPVVLLYKTRIDKYHVRADNTIVQVDKPTASLSAVI